MIKQGQPVPAAEPENTKQFERTSLEHFAEGKALRKSIKRSSLGKWKYTKDRDEVISLIKKQEETRVKELLPIRHARMTVSPFAFYRATAIVMADDLSHTPVTGITVQACGDAHITNFGVFASPERRLVFDINDFDETLPGPWEWDVKRLMASVEICGRHCGFSRECRNDAILQASKVYREAMFQFSETGNLALWYDHIDLEKIYRAHEDQVGQKRAKAIRNASMKAFSRDNRGAVSKLTEVADGRMRIVHRPPLVVPLRELLDIMGYETVTDTEKAIKDALKSYRKTLPVERQILIDRYHVVDIGRKVVGVGSVGTRTWIVVMEGISRDDPLVLQIKEAQESVLESYLPKSRFAEHGRRVIEGQRAIQTASDILLGWASLQGPDGKKTDYYVRQLWDAKGSVNPEKMRQDELAALASMCAWTLAHAHAKTGNRHKIAGYLGRSEAFDEAMNSFARSYADQNEKDYELFCQTLKNERY